MADPSSGMHLVESAGFHGAEALNVLRAAAAGAPVGSADLESDADADADGDGDG